MKLQQDFIRLHTQPYRSTFLPHSVPRAACARFEVENLTLKIQRKIFERKNMQKHYGFTTICLPEDTCSHTQPNISEFKRQHSARGVGRPAAARQRILRAPFCTKKGKKKIGRSFPLHDEVKK